MAIRERAITDVEINGQNAATVLKQLEDRADKYRKAMVEANKANDKVSFDKAQSELKKTEQSMRKLEKSTFDVNKVMKNLSGSSLKDLTRAKRQLNAELKNLSRGTAEYAAKSRQLRQVNGEVKKVRTEMNGVSRAQKGMFGGMSRGFLMVAGVIGGVMGVWRGFISTMKSTQQAGDALERTKQGLRRAILSLQQSIASGDWSNLVANMKNGYRAAADYAYALDELADRMRAVDVRTVEQKAEMEELRNIMSSTETATIEEREKAQDRYMELNKEILEATKKNADKMIEAERDRLKKEHDLKDEQVGLMIDFVREYDILAENELKNIKKVLDAEKDLADVRKDIEKEAKRHTAVVSMSKEEERQEQIDSLNRLVAEEKSSFSEREQAYYDLSKTINLFLDDQRDDVANALKSVANAQAQFETLQRNAVRRREALEREKRQREEDRKKGELEALEGQHQLVLLEIDRAYLEEHQNKKIHNQQLEAAEWAHLESLIAMRRHFNMDTTELERQRIQQLLQLREAFREKEEKISENQIAQNEAETEARLMREFELAGEELDIWLDKNEQKKQIDGDALEHQKQIAEQYKALTDNLAASLGDLLGRMATDAEMTAQEVAKNLLLIALDAAQATARIAIAEIWAKSLASAESVATFGAAGVIKATAISAIVEMAFAGLKAAASTIGQRQHGKYDVIGQEDGRQYNNLEYQGSMQTDIYGQPTLVGERGDELIVDNKTLRNVHINFPDVLPKIRASMVPQRAEGNVEKMIQTTNPTINSESNHLLERIGGVLDKLENRLGYGIVAKMSYNHWKEQVRKARDIEDRTSRS